ncbi:hypothetical protein SGI36_08540 [Providencia rettgeri]|uniref:hypothetical protein n=1 Tax=Providencia TaxID=586 RepID=UPI001B38BB72|nr:MULTISPECIES: hypothetical protein [Providencia]MBQ0530461.1 hypothetical protein [Providencia rettgeri]WOB85021.1 hypothetical protein P3L40_15340 [Providencia sp. PROV040]
MKTSEHEIKQRQDAERRRREREEEEQWETNFSLGIPQESTPSRWMRGEYE